ncbi:MAG: HD domain-containing protein [Collinsella sp.]|nr:HD domain-containing protein [Collinsella sp.]
MPRVDAIVSHRLFLQSITAIEHAERDRPFCRHGLPHLLDVARIAWARNLEEGLGLDRELVYAAALLHDVGRAEEYTSGEPHDEAGARVARRILGSLPVEARFTETEVEAILGAVAAHRGGGQAQGELARVLRFADKASRACFACPSRSACKWPDEKKNLTLSW